MLRGAARAGMGNSHENSTNPSPDRQGGVGPADCFNRSLTVAARYRILMLNGAAVAAWATPLKIPPSGGQPLGCGGFLLEGSVRLATETSPAPLRWRGIIFMLRGAAPEAGMGGSYEMAEIRAPTVREGQTRPIASTAPLRSRQLLHASWCSPSRRG